MAHFEDCKFFLRGACVNGPKCGFRHNEASCHTERLCNRWAAGYTCDGRCNLRHPSATEIAAIAAAGAGAARPPPTTAVRAVPPRQHQALAMPHSKFQQQQQQQQQQPTVVGGSTFNSAPPPCRFHARGRCAKGDACPFFHAPRGGGASASTVSPAAAVETTRAGSRARQDQDPTTLRGAAAAARKRQQRTLEGPFGENGSRQGVGTAGPGWGGGGDARTGNRAAANNGGSGGGGVPTGADAMAKARAADILQKHRLTSSAPAVEAGARGGMRVRQHPSAEPQGKKACTASPAQRRQSPHASTDGQARPAAGAAFEKAAATAPAAVVVASLPPSVVALASTTPPPSKNSNFSAENSERVRCDGDKNEQENCGREGLGADSSSGAKVGDVAGTEKAPSCDGAAVVRAHSEQQPQQQQKREQRTRTAQPAA
eukprot:g6710.t1